MIQKNSPLAILQRIVGGELYKNVLQGKTCLHKVLSEYFLSIYDVHALGQRANRIGCAHAAAVEVINGRGNCLVVGGRSGGDARVVHFYNLVAIPRLNIVCLFRAFRNINRGKIGAICKEVSTCRRRGCRHHFNIGQA